MITFAICYLHEYRSMKKCTQKYCTCLISRVNMSYIYEPQCPSFSEQTISIGKIDILRSWWRHQMETFSALLDLCAGNSPVTGEFPSQRPVTRSCDVFFDLGLNKRLSKQSWDWWFETPACSLWRHLNVDLTRYITLVFNQRFDMRFKTLRWRKMAANFGKHFL